MLSFAEKRALFQQFDELEEQPVSLGRLNYHFRASKRPKTIIVKYLHPNGNGFIYAPFVSESGKDGYVNIHEMEKTELIDLLKKALEYMSSDGDEFAEGYTEWYVDDHGEKLELSYENKMWLIYAFRNVEAVFKTREAALSYLTDEGFFKSK
ncbi:hypothetical protein [Listeria sp. PSOL-1]|uniref:hypothetical protein n=1 Tax=Listeria sp. PSOL-1 TaxID=1844999 RepID=UPI0013D5F20D|nr:hypothetical protein [Listeria sp. PSOL-1]